MEKMRSTVSANYNESSGEGVNKYSRTLIA